MRWVTWIEADIAALVIDCDDVAGSGGQYLACPHRSSSKGTGGPCATPASGLPRFTLGALAAFTAVPAVDCGILASLFQGLKRSSPGLVDPST